MSDNRQVSERMSHRLITIAEMLRDAEGVNTVADIGCDHGFISIYLLQSGIADKAIAMDVRKGPLEGAENNIREYGLAEKISVRLSDGLKELKAGEADAMVIAGMGGPLMQKILEEGDPKALLIRNAIVQPQSELYEFRQYLRNNGYCLADEQIVLEDGKYYFPMRVVIGDNSQVAQDALTKAVDLVVRSCSCSREYALGICNRFGEHNILRKDELLKSYLDFQKRILSGVSENLEGSAHRERYEQVLGEIKEIECVLELFNT